ncbi:PKD domain-containing protein [Singulisphaera sp. PoT]|uniref:PKD domain-containing protein n=1 Tax=Singulisphaera sp. PoT TaxID=3411797 RepID=UPI003BF570B4
MGRPSHKARKSLQVRKPLPRLNRGLLHLESLEDRLLLAGGLTASIIDTPTEKYALINPASTEPIKIFAQNDAASLQLFDFFRAPDGQAVSTTIEGRIESDDQEITGTFTFEELSGQTGVGVTVSDAALTFGNAVGIQFTGAGGAMALVPSGLAARITTDNVSDGTGLEVVGLPGLGLASSNFSYEINTTGADVDIAVPTPLGTENLTLDDGTDQLEGDATFTVGGPAPAFTVGGEFTITRGDNVLLIGGVGVALTLYAGPVKAITLSSETADFTLGQDEDDKPTFALVDDSFTVSGFTLLPGQGLPGISSGGDQLTFSASLGPIALEEVGLVIPALSFGTEGLSVDVGLSAASASLSFAKEGTEGESSGLMSAVAEDLTGSFTLAGDVDPDTGEITSVGSTGAFVFTAATFVLDVPGVLTATANGVAITYDPEAGESQEILRADDLTLAVPKLKLLGELTGSDDLPGLVVRTDGFAFGAARLTVEETVTLGALEITNPFVELGNFRFSNSEGVSLDRFKIGAGGIVVAAGGFTLTGEDVAAELGFDEAGAVQSFTFSVGTLNGQLGSLVTLDATDVELNPTATGSATLLSIGTATATVFIAAADLTLAGGVGGVVIAGDGTVAGPETLSISADFGADAGTKLKLPSFLPFKVDTLSLDWGDFDDHPDEFTIALTASVSGTIGPLTFSGGVDNIVIDPFRLAKGEFPIVALDGFSVGVSGDLFAGHVEGSVIGGIVKLDDEGNVLDDGETNFASTVFYAGINGGFQFGDMGVEILIGFSERGFLQGYLRADVPVTLEPIAGLTLSGFRGGISFNATPLPVPQSPDELLDPIFQPSTSLTADQWQEQLKQQVVNQVSGGSRIFIVEDDVSAIVDELDSGEIAAGSTLAAAFDDAGYAVADAKVSGEVTELEAGSLWQVKYLGDTYLIELRDGKLDVTSARFITEDDALTDSLGEGGAVTQPVLDAFADHELVLNAGAVVEVIARTGTTPSKWKITDGETVYYATIRGDRLAITGGDTAAADADAVVRIEAGATLYSTYVSQHTFRADVDIIITTDGKFVILGKATLADNVSVDLRLFADLSQVDKADPTDPLKMVFLGSFPATDGGPSLVTVKGQATIEFLDAAGNLVNPAVTGVAPAAFRFNILGRGEVGISSFATAVFGGDGGPDGGFAELDLQIANTPDATSVELNVSGSLSIEGLIPASNLVSAAGRVIISKEANGPVEIIGAVKLDFTTANPDLAFLQDAGISVDASLLLGFNTSTGTRDLDLTLPGRETETLTLDAASLILEGEGSLSLGQSAFGVGAQISFDGAFSARIVVDAPLLVLEGSAAQELDGGTIPQAIVDGLGLSDVATVSALVVPGAGPRWRIDDGTKSYYVVTRGDQLAVVDNSRAATDLTVRGDNGVDLDLFVAGRLDVSVTAGEEMNLLSLDAVGVLALRDLVGVVDGTPIAPQVVGRVDLLVSAGLQGVAEVEGSAQLLINTLGQAFTYAIPDRLQDRLQKIQDRRENAGGLTLPLLPVANGQLSVVVPGHATLLDGTPLADGPYFVLQFGDPDETTPPGGSTDPDGDGLVDVSMTIADAFRLEGDFRILVAASAFELDVSANASLSVPGAESLLNGEVTGRLRINSDGLIGYIALQGSLDIPQVDLGAGVEIYLGVNTTSTASTIQFQNPNLDDQALPAHSGILYVGGNVDIAGFGLDGSFSLLVGADSLEMEIHAGLQFFDATALRVDGTAGIYYGANPGLVLNTALTLGGTTSSGAPIPFGVAGIFQASAQLSLSIDTRVGFGEIAIKNLDLRLLSVITLTGDASISAGFDPITGEQFFRVGGSFSADLFGLATVSASGFFDSRGLFDVDINGRILLGTDDWGIRASVALHASYLPNASGVKTLNFGGSASGEVRAAGITLVGAGIGIDYNGSSGKATAMADVTILGITYDVDFTLGYFLLGSETDPRLGQLSNGVLTLNVGALGVNRNVGKKASVAEADEAYTLQSLGASTSGPGEDIILRAFGASQIFRNVTSVNADFGGGNDEFRVIVNSRQPVDPGLPIVIDGGAGNDMFINESAAAVTFRGGAGNDVLVGGPGADRLEGEGDDDFLFGGGGSDVLLGGAGMDRITWNAGDGQPTTIDGGADADTLTVKGTDAADTITVSPDGVNVRARVSGTTNDEVVGAGFETLAVNARGGADLIFVNDLTGTSITTVALNLGDIEGNQSSTGTTTSVTSRDDGAVDTAVVKGTSGNDTFGIDANGGLVRVTRSGSAMVTLAGITAGLDRLRIEGLAGADTMTLAGPRNGTSAGERIKIQLDGGDGADTYRTPIGGANFDGDGTDKAVFTVVDGDPTAITLTATQISSGGVATLYAGLAEVAIEAAVATAITVESTHAAATRIALGPVDSLVTVKATSGPLSVNASTATPGPNGDRLVIDQTGSSVPRVGAMTATHFSGFVDVTYSGFERIDVNLGGGSDVFTIDGTPAGPALTQINSGGGSDEIHVRAVGGLTTVNDPTDPGNAADRLYADFRNPGALTGSPFGDNLRFTAGKVVVTDISNSTTPVAWAYRDGRVYVGTVEVFNTIDTPTLFNLAGSLVDALTVEDTVDVLQRINVDGARVRITEGANVLSFNNIRNFNGFNYAVQVDGLAGVSSIAVSPDGNYLYAASQQDGALTVFSRDPWSGSLTFVQTLKGSPDRMQGLIAADAVVVSPDGKNVYVGSLMGVVLSFERVPSTGRLVYRGVYQDVMGITALAIAPDGKNVYATTTVEVVRLDRNTANGALTFGERRYFGTVGYNAIAISADGRTLFATGNALDGIHLLDGGKLTSPGDGSAAPADHVSGQYTDVAIGANNTVFASRVGGIDSFTYNDFSLFWTGTTALPNPAQPATATAVAVNPFGNQVVASYDVNSVPVLPPVRFLRLDNFHVINPNDDSSGDEPYIDVNGQRIYTGPQNGAGAGATVDLTAYYNRVLTTDATVVVREEDSIVDEPVGAPFTIGVNSSPGTYVVTLTTVDGFGTEFIRYQLTYTIYDVPIPTPTISPIVSFNTSFGQLVNPQQINLPGVRSLADLEFGPDGQQYYGASFDNGWITQNDQVAAYEGQWQFATTTAATQRDDIQTTLSPDGRHAYSISTKFGVLTVADVDPSNGALGDAKQVIPAGLTDGASVAISPDGKNVYVTNPAEDSVSVFIRDPNSGQLFLDQVFTDGIDGVDGLDGARSLAVSADGNRVFVAGYDENAIAVFSRDPNTGRLTYSSSFTDTGLVGPSSLTTGAEGQLYVASVGTGKLFWLADGPTLSVLGVSSNGVGGVTGMSNPVAIALSPDGTSLYVTSKLDSSVVAFKRDPGTGALSFVQSLRDGSGGVQGIDGAVKVIVSGDGKYVVVAGGTDTLAVFGRDPSTGALTVLQQLRDGSAGMTGIDGVSDLDFNGGRLYVSSAGSIFGSGGVAVLNVAANTPPPRTYDVSFDGVESLTVQSAGGGDIVNAGEVAVPFTLNTQGGADFVTLRNTGAGKATTVNLGNDGDTLDLLSTGDNSTTTVNGGDGGDTIRLYANGTGASTTLNGGDGADQILVDGARLRSQVTVNGDAPNAGDTLTFDAHGQTTDPGAPQPNAGSVKISAADFGVTYATIEQINILGSPTADAGGSYTIAEGGSLKLDGSASLIPAGHTVVSYEWTVGDRAITGSSPETLTWDDLVAAGIADDGTYTVTLKVTTTLGGQTYSNTDVATLTVTNTAPTLSLSGAGTVEVGSLFTLGLASVDPGTDAVHTWTVNWGDGSPAETFNGTPATATHIYTSAASRTISVVAMDEDGSYGPVTKALVVAGARALSGPATVNEGSNYTLTLGRGVAGLPAIARWAINWGDGSPLQTVANDPTTVSHVYAGDGSYTISAVALDVSGILHPAGNTLGVTVLDVAPVVTLSQSSPAPVEGNPTRPLILNVQVTDPGNETVTGYVVSWGDGTTSIVKGTDQPPLHIYADAATYQVTVTSLTNSDGTFANPAAPLGVVVADVAPRIISLTVAPSPGEEGGTAHVSTLAVGPIQGSDTLTFAWAVTGPNGYSRTFTGTVNPDGAVLPDDPATLFPTLPAELLGQARAYPGSFDFVTPDNGRYVVTLTLSDDDGSTVSQSAELMVANLPPRITTFVVPTTGTEAQPITLAATASDPGGSADPLTYRWKVTNVRTGIVLTLDGPTVSFVPDGGAHSVELTVSDGDGGQEIRTASIAVASLAPEIVAGSIQVPTTANEAATVSFAVAGLDNNGSASGLRYAWTVLGPGGSVARLAGATVPFTFPDNGIYLVSVTITDDENQSTTSDPISVTVANLNPTIDSVDAPTSGTEGVPLHLSATASDPAGAVDPVSAIWTLTSPGGAKTYLYGNAATFTPDDNGTYQVSLTVRDDDGGSTTRDLAPVVVANANPTLGSIVVPTGPLFEGDTVALSVSGNDVPGDLTSLIYTWTITTPAGDTITLTGPAVSFPTDDSGTYAVRVDLADGDGGTASRTTSVTVANLDPTLRSTTVPTTGYVGHEVALLADATDVAGDLADLVYTWTIAPPTGPDLIVTGSLASFTPAAAGRYGVTLMVTDGDGGQVTSAQSVVDVKATPITIGRVNVPTTGQEGSPINLSAIATDALGGPLTFTWTLTPATGPAITLVGRDVTFIPTDNGSYAVSLRASNDNGEATASAGTIAVANVDPVLTSLSWPDRALIGSAVSLRAQASDPAGAADPLTYAWTVTRPDGTTFTMSGPSAGFLADQLGSYGLKLVVRDGDGGQVTAQKLLAVPNAPPVANAGGPYLINEGGSLTLDATATTDPNQSASTLKYEWDLNGDGIYTDATGSKPTLSWAQLQALGLDDGPATFNARVRVTDDYGDFHVASALGKIANVAPVLTSLTWPDQLVLYSLVNLQASATDAAGDADPLTYSWTVTRPDGSTFSLSGPSTQFIADQLGNFGLKLVVADDDGGQVITQKLLNIFNPVPVANAGGPYLIHEGDSLNLDANATTDANQPSSTLKYEWDLNGDGIYTDAIGSNPTLTWAQLQALGIDDGPAAFSARVRVTDEHGAVDIASAAFTVQNTAPTVASLISDHGNPGANPSPDGVIRISGTVADPGRDTHFVRVNWGDGSAVQTFAVNPGTMAFDAAHNYATGGIYNVNVVAVDSDSAASQAVATKAVVSGIGVVDGVLYVVGTEGRDNIRVTARNNGLLEVDARLNANTRSGNRNLRQAFGKAGLSSIVVVGYGGNDVVNVQTVSMRNGQRFAALGASVPAIVLGGDGNDDLRSGIGNSILVGGAGNDRLNAGIGRSVLIGGLGRDRLQGGLGQDILIGGFTNHDENLVALDQVLAKWASPGSYETRVGDLLSTSLIPGVTVHDDGASDDMRNQPGRDWFFGDFRSSPGTRGKDAFDRRAGERLDQLPVAPREPVVGSPWQFAGGVRSSRIQALQFRQTEHHRPGLHRLGGWASIPRRPIQGLSHGRGLGH